MCILTIVVIVIDNERRKEVPEMVSQRHSRQRDAVYAHLCARYDHPTAEEIYFSVKQEFPALSLATVYRNLTQLCEEGKAQKIAADGVVRFDGNACGHSHLICNLCRSVIDLPLDAEPIIEKARTMTDNDIISGAIMLYGTCKNCKMK